MSETLKIARDDLAELRKRREAYAPDTVRKLQDEFRRKKRMPPGVFHDSSSLVIRSFDRATGVRPFSGITFWHSPDLTLSPVTNLGTAKVEHFLVDPTICFSTQFAENLTLGGGYPRPSCRRWGLPKPGSSGPFRPASQAINACSRRSSRSRRWICRSTMSRSIPGSTAMSPS